MANESSWKVLKKDMERKNGMGALYLEFFFEKIFIEN